MLKKLKYSPAVILLLLPGLLFAATPEESLKANFPDLQIESVSKTPVEGVYEVVSGGRVLYYAPAAECLILGEIITKTGQNLTQAKEMEIISAKMKQVPLDKAIRIGDGKNVIVEFTDVDCQYCRAASSFLKDMGNLSRYIFFVSLSGNPRTEAKTKYIFCAEDKKKAYEDAMAGQLDDMKFKQCESKEAAELFDVHKQLGQKVGVPGTPCFLVNGKAVMGANLPEISKLLEAGPK
jgi:thiol:disulfide interchange protein DsbC